MKTKFDFNDVVWGICEHFVELPQCPECKIPNARETFWVVQPLYIFEKIERFDGFINYGATEHPISEFINPNHSFNWYSITPVLEDNNFDKKAKFRWHIFSTKEEAIKEYLNKYSKKSKFYKHCLNEYLKARPEDTDAKKYFVPEDSFLSKIIKKVKKHE